MTPTLGHAQCPTLSGDSQKVLQSIDGRHGMVVEMYCHTP